VEYVLGFMFNDVMFDRVVLIRKNRPEWQAGKLNGVGGKIEPGETPEEAMRREFLEETSLDHRSWHLFTTLTTVEGHVVHCFRARCGSDYWNMIRTVTDETVVTRPVHELTLLQEGRSCMPNVAWLAPMALSFYRGERCRSFETAERRGL
jgi:8-oxo-dGTP diphosphatase